MSSPLPPARTHRRRWLQAAASLAALATPLGSRAAAGTTIRLSHVVATDTPKGMALERFRMLVEERTAQRIRVQIYPQGQLYGDQDEMQALQLGAIDMVAPSLSKFGPIGFPEFELFDLPFLFESVASVRHITQGPVGQRLLAGLSRQRLLGLGYFDNGFKHMSANRPLLEPAHFAGLRMRVQSSRVIAQQMRALGAWPITLPFSETRRALENGVVEGTENPVSNFYTQGMQAVQSDLSLTGHGYLGYAVVAHQRFWLGLPSADRTLVQQALREALAFGNGIADAHNDKSLAALHVTETVRIHTPTEAQRARLREAVAPVHADLARRIGQDWLDAVHNALDRERLG